MEFVYVVPTPRLMDEHIPVGFSPNLGGFKTDLNGVIKNINKHGFFMERKYAEKSQDYKQIIPYCVVSQGNDILLTRRMKGDPRLTNKFSIGLGGHINPCDIGVCTGLVNSCLHREIFEEELYIELPSGHEPKFNLSGIIYDNKDEVGRVHFGLLYRLHLPDNANVRISPRTKELTGIMMSSLAVRELMFGEGKTLFEGWSAFILASNFKLSGAEK